MRFDVRPGDGIGLFRLGMPREDARSLFPTQRLRTFRRNQFADSDTDYFEQLGILVDYDKDDRCNFITAAAAAQPVFQDMSVVGAPYDKYRHWFKHFDDTIKEDATGFTSEKLGICVFLESAGEDLSAPIEAVSVFGQGYYE